MDKTRPTQNKAKATGSFHASTSQPVKAGPSKSSATTSKGGGKASANPTPTTSADAQNNEAAPTAPVMAPPSPPQRIDDDLSAAWQVVSRRAKDKAPKRNLEPTKTGTTGEEPAGKPKKWKRPTKLQRYRAAQLKAQKGELPRVTESPIPDQVSPQAGPSGQCATGSGRRPPEPTTISGKGTAPVKGKAPQRPVSDYRDRYLGLPRSPPEITSNIKGLLGFFGELGWLE
ncbi:hypothetical protein RR48_08597 [Papilio machaon]|uniref:Uncharacterized protein n=1 Tax=Papilio machaon TaxID=76193 RepID=A0A194RN36_PAPMA|nr:hypothetical protein RR48_08597 [Papilio machaon]